MENDHSCIAGGWQSRRNVDAGNIPPAPGKQHARAKLSSATDVSRELAKLHREARSGRIDVADASRLANMLSILSRILSETELERRVEALEQKEGC